MTSDASIDCKSQLSFKCKTFYVIVAVAHNMELKLIKLLFTEHGQLFQLNSARLLKS